MKKIFLILIILFFPIFCKAENFNLKSNNVLLYNLNDNEILYEKNKDEKVAIASITKVLTAMTVIENQKDLNKYLTLSSKDFAKVEELNLATAGFKIGDKLTYEDLLYGLLFPSGAECALALANNTFSSYDEFIEKMNNLSKKIGMKNSSFTNPIGYDEDNHFSTVNDVSLLFKYAIENKIFKKIITSKYYYTNNGVLLKNNTLNKYKSISKKNYMIAGKTGTTKKAGYALASIVKKNNVNLLLVTTNTPFDYKAYYNFYDAFTIYEYYLNNYEYKIIAKKNNVILKLPTKYAKEKFAEITVNQNLKKYVNKNNSNVKYIYKGKKIITPSIPKNTKLGKINIYVNNNLVGKLDAYLKESLTFSIAKWIKGNKFLTIIILFLILLFTLFILSNLKKFTKKYLKKKYKRLKY